MQILTEHIREWHKENDRQPEDDAGAIHPSSLGDCNRRTIYKYRGLPRDLEFNDYKKKIFFHGYRIEDWMTEALRDKGLLIASSVPVRAEYKGVPIEGTIDQSINWEDGWCIADTKSISDHAFKYKSFPYHHHILQVGLYQWALREMMSLDEKAAARLAEELKPLDAPEGWGSWFVMLLWNLHQCNYGSQYPPMLFYVGRGNLKELEPVTAGDGCMDLALEKLDELIPYIEKQVYPSRPFRTPTEHPYLCATCHNKGYKSKKTGRWTTPPEYAPNCEWFQRCWGVMPERWSYWSEVKK